MSAVAGWAVDALPGSTVLMLFVLALRLPARRWIGPRLAYALWALPALRMITPLLPVDLTALLPVPATSGLKVLAVGASSSGVWANPATSWQFSNLLFAAWLTGAAVLMTLHITRHVRFRRRLLATAKVIGHHATIRILAGDVDGPLAFGIVRRFVAVPQDFTTRYTASEQRLALAHEFAHHARGDLAANWAALAILALHWWNPIAWVALHALREDQEFAVDASVLAQGGPGTRPDYAHVLAKAAGLGGPPICNLNPRSNLKERLMMLAQDPLPNRRRIVGGSVVTLLAASVLAATVSVAGAATPPTAKQAVTIGVKPDGAGGYALIVGGKAVAADARLPGGAILPADFSGPGGCDLKPGPKPFAMAIKGGASIQTYTVMCASAAPASVPTTLQEGLASLQKMRGSVATQPASAAFPEAERTHALGAIDRSIHEVEALLKG